MKVYIVCKRYIDKINLYQSTEIKYVYSDREKAYEKLNEKESKNDFNWFVVTKELRGKCDVL